MARAMRLLSCPLGLILPLLVVATGCYQPLTAEGIACSQSGSCPTGQSCGPDGRCWRQPVDSCTPGSCEEGLECGADNTCRPAEQIEPTVDGRSYVGHVVRSGAAPNVKVLGTMVSSRVVLTCKDCLDTATPEDLLFAPDSLAVALSIRDIVRHQTADMAALVLQAPLSSTPIRLATEPPLQGSEYIAVVPDMNEDLVRYKIQVLVEAIADDEFSLAASQCTAAGGPTFGADGSDDILHGVHRSMACTGLGAPYSDLRIDRFLPWIEEQIANAEPETCADADPTCPGECASFECIEKTGGVITSCEADDSLCPTGEFCSSDLSCLSCTPDETRACGQCGEQTCGADGQWGSCEGQPVTLQCGSCGRNYCQLDGNFGGCVSVASLCGSGQTCDAQGAQFACNAVTCSTAGNDQFCELTGSSPPSTVNAGMSWLTGRSCLSGGCRSCSCSDSGTVSCSPGCFQ